MKCLFFLVPATTKVETAPPTGTPTTSIPSMTPTQFVSQAPTAYDEFATTEEITLDPTKRPTTAFPSMSPTVQDCVYVEGENSALEETRGAPTGFNENVHCCDPFYWDVTNAIYDYGKVFDLLGFFLLN